MKNIVTIQNVTDIEFSAMVELLHPIYCKEIPEVSIGDPPNLLMLEGLMIFFSNQYSYIVELWATMSYQVRLLKRTSKNKDEIDVAMDKRDYLEKVMSATKLKYYSSSGLLKYHADDKPR